jgi:dUTP pyrophosphatase
LYTTKRVRIGAGGVDKVPTGVAFNIPPGYFGKVYDRSGVSSTRPLTIKAGVIDAGYIGEIILVVYNHGDMPEVIDEGTKLAQIAIHELPAVELVQVEELETTDRADKGFGHSDKK